VFVEYSHRIEHPPACLGPLKSAPKKGYNLGHETAFLPRNTTKTGVINFQRVITDRKRDFAMAA
jgi:hypothetical protein